MNQEGSRLSLVSKRHHGHNGADHDGNRKARENSAANDSALQPQARNLPHDKRVRNLECRPTHVRYASRAPKSIAVSGRRLRAK